MPDETFSVKDFAARIKSEYPDYAGVDDYELTQAFVRKYPKRQRELKPYRRPGAEKLIGTSPALLQHWEALDTEFEAQGINSVSIKSGYRTAERQNYLHTHGFPTKGNDGYKNLSPHQDRDGDGGNALDISFAPEDAPRGHEILRRYATKFGLHVPSDEPWHIAIPRGTKGRAPRIQPVFQDATVQPQAPAPVAVSDDPRGINPAPVPWPATAPLVTGRTAVNPASNQAEQPPLPSDAIAQEPNRSPMDPATKAGGTSGVKPPRAQKTAQPEDVIVRDAITNVPKLEADLKWHFGPSAIEDARALGPGARRKMILYATQQAARDDEKKAAGQVLTESREYQNKQRARVGLKPMGDQPAGAPAIGMGDVRAYEGEQENIQRIISEERANMESPMPLRERLIARGFTHDSADQIAAGQPQREQPRGPVNFTGNQKQALRKLGFDEDDERRIAAGGYPKGVRAPSPERHAEKVREQLTKNLRTVVADEFNLKSKVTQGMGTTGAVEGASNDAPAIMELTPDSPEVQAEAANRVEAMMQNPMIVNMPLRAFEEKTISSWLDEFKRGSAYDKARDVARVLPFAGQGVQIGEALRIYSLAKKLEKGKANDADKRELAAFQVESTRDGSTAYQVASIVAQLPAFATELALTGGSYSAGKKATSRILTRMTENAIAEELLARAPSLLQRQGIRDLAGLTGRVTKSLVGSAVQTPLARAGSIYAGTVQHMTPQFEFEDGKLTGAKTKEGKPLSAAVARSIISEYIEVATEHSGGIFEAMGKLGSTKAIKRGFATLAKLPEGTPEELAVLLKRGGWHGPTGEMFEERVGDVAHWINGDQDRPFAPAGQLGIEAIAFSVPEIALRLIPGASRAFRKISGADKRYSSEDHRQLTEALREIHAVWEKGTDENGQPLQPIQRAVLTHAWDYLTSELNAKPWAKHFKPLDFIEQGLTPLPEEAPAEAQPVTKKGLTTLKQQEREASNELSRLVGQLDKLDKGTDQHTEIAQEANAARDRLQELQTRISSASPEAATLPAHLTSTSPPTETATAPGSETGTAAVTGSEGSRQDEKIVTAAMQMSDGSIVTGKNHPQILLGMGRAVEKDRSGKEYGFVTSTGRFVSREEAAKIAGVPNTIKQGSLYTEDLTAAKKAAGHTDAQPEMPTDYKTPEGRDRMVGNIVGKLRDDMGKVSPEDIEELDREMPATKARALLDKYEDDIRNTPADLVNMAEEAKLLPEHVAAYRQARIEDRDHGERFSGLADDEVEKLEAALRQLAGDTAGKERGQTPSRKIIIPQALRDRATTAQQAVESATTDEARETARKELSDAYSAVGAFLTSTEETVDAAAHEAAHSPTNELAQPTKAQKLAGNYRKGHVAVAGLDISVENPEGSERTGTDSDGKKWSMTMQSHYGYIKGSEGKDHEHIDVFVRPGTPKDYSGPVFVVNQLNDADRLDEHKVMLGWDTDESAKEGYLANYTPGWDRFGSIAMFPTVDAFKKWLAQGDQSKKAVTPELGQTESKGESADDDKRTVTETAPSPVTATEAIEGKTADSGVGSNTPAPDLRSVFADELAKLKAPTARESATKAVTEAHMGLQDAFRGLGELFSAAPGTLGSGAVFDSETYERAKPFFEASFAHFRASATSAADSLRALMRALGDKFSVDQLAQMEPYMIRFVEEQHPREIDLTRRGPSGRRNFDASKDSLSQAVRAFGGIRPDVDNANAGELGRISKKESGTTGLVNRNGTYTAEDMALRCATEGYRGEWLEISHTGYHPSYDVDGNAFLQAVENDARGIRKSYAGDFDQDYEALYKANAESEWADERQAEATTRSADKLVELLEEGRPAELFDRMVEGNATADEQQEFRHIAWRSFIDYDEIENLIRGAQAENLSFDAEGEFAEESGGPPAPATTSDEQLAAAPGTATTTGDEVPDIDSGTDQAQTTPDERTTETSSAVGAADANALGPGGADSLETVPTESVRGTEPERGATSGAIAGTGQSENNVRGTSGERSGTVSSGGTESGSVHLPDGRERAGNEPAGDRPVDHSIAAADADAIKTDRTPADIIDGATERAADNSEEGSGHSASLTGEYFVSDIESFSSGSLKQKYQRNVDAIVTLRKIQSEGRERATPEEQATMARYIGWGQFPALMNEINDAGRDWATERTALKSLLSEQEWESAKASIKNAHYTAPQIVNMVWDTVRRLGFKQGRTLEPSMGVGNFFALMPRDIRKRSQIVGVELDKVTGQIAKLLYPNADIHIKGFEDYNVSDNFFDLIISNFPFGDYQVADPAYPKRLKSQIHDYFFVRSIDKVRPGGLVVGITSTGTLDKQTNTVREHLATQADLVAAIRLPANTFLKEAGTSVVTDLIILRKRIEGEEVTPELARIKNNKWLNTVEVPDPLKKGPIPVNEYFAQHPEMIIGTFERSGTMYRGDSPNVTRGADFEDHLQRAIASIPEKIFEPIKLKAFEPQRLPAPEELKQGSYTIQDGKLFQKTGEHLVEQKPSKETLARVTGMIGVRDAVNKLLYVEMERPAEAVAARKELNRVYDAFVKEHGYLSEAKNAKAFADDPDRYRIFALEHWDKKTKKATKTDVFTKSTRARYERPEKAEGVADAVGISLNETGAIDLDRLGELLGIASEDVGKSLVEQGIAFNDPQGGWATRDAYLSGPVRQKLLEAREAARVDSQYQANVTALEAVQPEDVPYSKISARMGAPWIPSSDIAQFMGDMMSTQASSFKVIHDKTTGRWYVSYSDSAVGLNRSVKDKEELGTPNRSFPEIVQAAIDDRPIKVTVRDGDVTYVDRRASAAANKKVKEIRKKFAGWIWQDDARRQRLHRQYNERYNDTIPLKVDGSHQTFPGMNDLITLRDNQKNVVWRIVSTGRVLMAHEVGTGKTFAMIAAGMERRRLKLSRKPAIVCLNSNVAQVTAAAHLLYPNARILAAHEGMDGDARQRTITHMATGDWDLVILTHDNLELIPLSQETQEHFVRKEIADLMAAVLAAKLEAGTDTAGNRAVKDLEKKLENRKAALRNIIEKPKDNAITFEETGIDFLMVDEAHKFKSLPVYTARGSVKGIPTSRSDRATNMYMRSQWLLGRNNQQGLVFATGTPISNTLVELFNMQRYLQGAELDARGINHFDSWAANFAESQTKLEYTPTGDWLPVTRFSLFTNLADLSHLASQMMDVAFADEIEGLDRPKRKDQVLTVPMSVDQKAYLQLIRRRATALAHAGRPKKGADNWLVLTNDARKAAIDMRLIDRNYPDDPNSKLNRLINEALADHKANPKQTQLIFSDMGINPTDRGISLYEDIIAKLVKGGIPRDQIIDFSKFSPGSKADQRAKAEGMERLSKGTAKIGLGGTEKLGTGVNVQELLANLHHLDAPYRPSDIEQRDGRGWRDGNTNEFIGIKRYTTEGSFDTQMWQTLDTKNAFIRSFMRGNVSTRTMEEHDTEELSYAEIMATTSGNPLLIKKMELEAEAAELESDFQVHQDQDFRLKDRIAARERENEWSEVRIKDFTIDAETYARTAAADWSVTINGDNFTRDLAEEEAAQQHDEELRAKTEGMKDEIATAKKAIAELKGEAKEKGLVGVAATNYVKERAGRAYDVLELAKKTVGGDTEQMPHTKIAEATKAFRDAIGAEIDAIKTHWRRMNDQKETGQSASFATYRGFDVVIAGEKEDNLYPALVGPSGRLYAFSYASARPGQVFDHAIDGELAGLERSADRQRGYIANNDKEIAELRPLIDKPFAEMEALDKLRKQIEEVTQELTASGAAIPMPEDYSDLSTRYAEDGSLKSEELPINVHEKKGEWATGQTDAGEPAFRDREIALIGEPPEFEGDKEHESFSGSMTDVIESLQPGVKIIPFAIDDATERVWFDNGMSIPLGYFDIIKENHPKATFAATNSRRFPDTIVIVSGEKVRGFVDAENKSLPDELKAAVKMARARDTRSRAATSGGASGEPLGEPEPRTAEQNIRTIIKTHPTSDVVAWRQEMIDGGYPAVEVSAALTESADMGIDPARSDDLHSLDSYMTALEGDASFRESESKIGNVKPARSRVSPQLAAGSGATLSPDPFIGNDDPAEIHAMAIANARFPLAELAEPGFEKGNVSAREVIKSFEDLLAEDLGRPTPIRVGKMGTARARGFYRPYQEIIRIKTANNIPTAAHETGHAIQKIIYGDTMARSLTVPRNVRRELVALGKALYGTSKPAGGYRTEGFAEFMRYYLTRDDAGTVAPSTLHFFETQVLTRHPGLAAGLQRAKEKVDTYRKQGAANRATANTQRQMGISERVDRAVTAFKRLPTQIIEQFTPLMHLADAVSAISGPMTFTENPYLAASVLRGSASARTTYMVEEGMLDFAGAKVGGSLKEAAAIVKGRRKQFTTYLWAKRSQERWRHMKQVIQPDGTITMVPDPKDPGMSIEDADALVAQLETPEFQIAAQKVYDWNAGVLRYVKEAAPQLAPAVDKILATSDSYIPLARVFDVEEVKRSKFEGSSGASPLKRMKGSGRAIKDPFPQMIANAERMISLAHKKFVLDAIIKLSGREGVGHLVEEVPKNQIPHSASTDEIIQRLTRAGADIDLTGANLDEVMTFFSPAMFPKGQDPIVPYMTDGQMRWYYVHPDLYNTLMGLDIYRLPRLADLIFGIPTRLKRAGTTGLRPAFALLTNPGKDLQTFIMQTQSHKNPAQLAAYWSLSMGTAFSPARLMGKQDGLYADLFDLFHRLGAQMGQPLGIDMAITHKTAKRLFRGKIINTVTSPLNLVQEFLSLPESASRVAELRALIDEVGWTPGTPMTLEQSFQLALAAKRVTTDFSAAGSFARMYNACVPFFNASIQGGRRFAVTMRAGPHISKQIPISRRAVLRGLLLITIPTLLGWWRLKDEPWWTDMPWREKFGNWHLPFGDQVIEIPRAFEWGNLFAVIPEAIFDSWYRKDPEGVKAAVGHVFETTVPEVLPVVAQQAKEQWQNRIEFFDRPMVPRSELDLPPGEQRTPYSSAVAVWLGKRFPDTVSPRRVDALIRGFGGGVAPDVLNAVGLGGQRGVRERELSDLPVIGRAFRRGGKEGIGSATVDKFYDTLNRVRARAASLDRPETNEQREYRLILEDAYKAISVLRTVQMEIPSLAGRQQVSTVTREIAGTAQDLSLTAEERVAKLEATLGKYPALTAKVEEEVLREKDVEREERLAQPKGRSKFNLPGSANQRAMGGAPSTPKPPTP